MKRKSRLDLLVRTLEATRRAGIRIEVNFMFGWPWDTGESLQNTLENIRFYSKYVDRIGHHGNVIPIPGTTFYDEYKDRFSYEKWWLKQNFGLRYGMLPVQPFYRTFHFEDYGFFNFFDHSRKNRRLMKKIISFIGNFNTKQRCSTWKSRCFFRALTRLSKMTFPISPALERFSTRLPMRLFEYRQQRKRMRSGDHLGTDRPLPVDTAPFSPYTEDRSTVQKSDSLSSGSDADDGYP